MSSLQGGGVTCLILQCTHSCYENEMMPQLNSRPKILSTRTKSGTEQLEIYIKIIIKKGSQAAPHA